MKHDTLEQQAARYLRKLCVEIPGRGVGSHGNRMATEFFASVVHSFGFATETPLFRCVDWIDGGAALSVNDVPVAVFSSPYSKGCDVIAPLVVVSTVQQLEAADLGGAIVLLRGAIAAEPLMPKKFPFYNPEAHQRIIGALERKQPRAILAATARNPEMAGAIYPFPLIEDGDFDIPSAYMTDEAGTRLMAHAGGQMRLTIDAMRREATGCNVIARKGGDPDRRVALLAHIDAKAGTPGALDNASGIVVLLLLAELLAEYDGRLAIELVAINGEDYYSNPGEQQYLAQNAGAFDNMLLGINIDGAGYREGRTAYSLYNCSSALASVIRHAFSGYAGLTEGAPWYQGDHGLFLLNQRPAVAITSERALELLSTVIHTDSDRPDLVDPCRLVDLAQALHALLLALSSAPSMDT